MPGEREGAHDPFPVLRALQDLATQAQAFPAQRAPQPETGAVTGPGRAQPLKGVEHDPGIADEREGPCGIAQLGVFTIVGCSRHGVAQQP